MKLSVVIPCFRSQDSLSTLVAEVISSLAREDFDYEVILVVDGSPDSTAVVARRIASGHVRVIELLRNYGQHNALVAGIRAASGDIVVTMDDDGQHPASEIVKLVGALRANTDLDLVYGMPAREEHGLLRSLASRAIKRSLAASGVPHARIVGAFRAFRSEVSTAVVNTTDPSVNVDVALSWATNRVAPVHVEMRHRSAGRSGYRISALVAHAFNMITGYGILPLKLASWAGFAFALIALILFVSVLVRFAIGETTVAGFTTLAAMIALFASAQMFAIGIIGEYLGRQHFRSMQRPVFLVRSDTALSPGEARERRNRDEG